MNKIKKIRLTYLIVLIIIFSLSLALFDYQNFNLKEQSNLIESNIKQQEFYIQITKLNIIAPVLNDVDWENKENYRAALRQGVAHMRNTAKPNSNYGNVVIFAHSSDFEDNFYNKIFSNLDELMNGDQITVGYQSEIYTYTVFEKKIVRSDDVSIMNQSEEKELTLFTCWPIGTSEKRLIIKAR